MRVREMEIEGDDDVGEWVVRGVYSRTVRKVPPLVTVLIQEDAGGAVSQTTGGQSGAPAIFIRHVLEGS